MAVHAANPELAERISAARAKSKLSRSLIVLVVLALVFVSVETTIIADTDWERMGSVGDVLRNVGQFLAVDWSLFPNLVGPALETIMVATLGTLLGVSYACPQPGLVH